MPNAKAEASPDAIANPDARADPLFGIWLNLRNNTIDYYYTDAEIAGLQKTFQ